MYSCAGTSFIRCYQVKRRNFLTGLFGGLVAASIPAINIILENKVIQSMFGKHISVVRKIHPTMLAEQIIGVQPMTEPVGEIFEIRYSNNHTDEERCFPSIEV